MITENDEHITKELTPLTEEKLKELGWCKDRPIYHTEYYEETYVFYSHVKYRRVSVMVDRYKGRIQAYNIFQPSRVVDLCVVRDLKCEIDKLDKL